LKPISEKVSGIFIPVTRNAALRGLVCKGVWLGNGRKQRYVYRFGIPGGSYTG
jgi:hypothetical protein